MPADKHSLCPPVRERKHAPASVLHVQHLQLTTSSGVQVTCRAGGVVLSASTADVTEALTLHAAGGCVSVNLTQASMVLCGCRLYSAHTLTALQQVGSVRLACNAPLDPNSIPC